MQPERKTRSPALTACEYGPIAAGAFSVVTGVKEEWVVTVVGIFRVTFATDVDRETLNGVSNNPRLVNLGVILMPRAANFDRCWNISCAMITGLG